MMIAASLAAFFGSLLPLVLAQFQLLAPIVWLVCCPLLAVYAAGVSLNVYRRTSALASNEDYSRPWFAPIIYLVSWLLVIALISTTFGLLPGHAVYIMTIAWQLALASIQFLLLVLQTKPRSAA